MTIPSKRAVWLAVNSKHGNRLVEIMQEHTKLVASLISRTNDPTDRAIIEAKIESLRRERDAIITLFDEEVESDA